MLAVALPAGELPAELVARHPERVHHAPAPELRFYWRAVPAFLPVWWEGRLQVVRWGNRDRSEPRLPPTGWTWRASVERGRWAWADAEPVDIPARGGYMGGVWFKVTEGARGILVRDGRGRPLVYMVCEPATRYFGVMTRSEWAPCLINQVI